MVNDALTTQQQNYIATQALVYSLSYKKECNYQVTYYIIHSNEVKM